MTERSVDYCRCCGSKNMTMFLPLGAHPPANAFLKEEELKEEVTFELNTYACVDCGLIQIPNRIPDDFFRHYLYVPSASATMHVHFTSLAKKLQDRYLKDKDDLLIDVGCNDGLLLKAAHDIGINTLGVDPAENIGKIAKEKGLEIYGEYFNPDTAKIALEKYGPATVITTSNTFNHIDDLRGFMEGVRVILKKEGVFIVEVPRAIEYKTKLMFDNIYHEHLSVFSVKSLKDLYADFDMEIFDLEYIDVQGGSMRVFARAKSVESEISDTVGEWLENEAKLGLYTKENYENYKVQIDRIQEKLMSILDSLTSSGKKVAGYGAPAKGNTLLNYYGIGPDRLLFLADRNVLKHGRFSPGMHIPVVSTDRIQEDKPDYLLILAWNFADEIIEQQKAFRESGGKFIMPLPDPKIID